MTDEVHETPEGSENYLKIGIVAVVAVAILTGITILAYQYAKGRSSTTVLPGGTTYLGPGQENQQNTPPPAQASKFNVDASTPWQVYKGKKYNFSFSYPTTLPIVVFPNDITDSVAISWNNVPPQNNIMVRVNDIRNTEPKMIQYIGDPQAYVNNWWKQWSGLKGVKEVTTFTNSKGMTGYRAVYINTADQTPNENVFFTVPGRTDLMVMFANGSLEKTVFDKIIDSFTIATGSPKTSSATPSATGTQLEGTSEPQGAAQ